MGGELVCSVAETDDDYDLARACVEQLAQQQSSCRNPTFGAQRYRAYSYSLLSCRLEYLGQSEDAWRRVDPPRRYGTLA